MSPQGLRGAVPDCGGIVSIAADQPGSARIGAWSSPACGQHEEPSRYGHASDGQTQYRDAKASEKCTLVGLLGYYLVIVLLTSIYTSFDLRQHRHMEVPRELKHSDGSSRCTFFGLVDGPPSCKLRPGLVAVTDSACIWIMIYIVLNDRRSSFSNPSK